MIKFKTKKEVTTVALKDVATREVFTYPQGHEDSDSVFMKITKGMYLDVFGKPKDCELIVNLTTGYLGYIKGLEQVRILKPDEIVLS